MLDWHMAVTRGWLTDDCDGGRVCMRKGKGGCLGLGLHHRPIRGRNPYLRKGERMAWHSLRKKPANMDMGGFRGRVGREERPHSLNVSSPLNPNPPIDKFGRGFCLAVGLKCSGFSKTQATVVSLKNQQAPLMHSSHRWSKRCPLACESFSLPLGESRASIGAATIFAAAPDTHTERTSKWRARNHWQWSGASRTGGDWGAKRGARSSSGTSSQRSRFPSNPVSSWSKPRRGGPYHNPDSGRSGANMQKQPPPKKGSSTGLPHRRVSQLRTHRTKHRSGVPYLNPNTRGGNRNNRCNPEGHEGINR